jgi:hypothetical protein
MEYLAANYERLNAVKPDPVSAGAGLTPEPLEYFPLEGILSTPQYFVGYDFLTKGIVVQATRTAHLVEGDRWFVTVRPEDSEGMQGSCYVALPRPTKYDLPFPSEVDVGDMVRLHATVLAFGTFETLPGEPVNTTTFACAGISLIHE